VKQPSGCFVRVALAVLLAGCSSGLSANSKPIGAEGGACTPGGGCDPGLLCLSHLCVRLDDAAVPIEDTAVRTEDLAVRSNDTAFRADDVAVRADDVVTRLEDVAVRLDDAAVRMDDVAVRFDDAMVRTDDVAVRFDDAAVRVDASVDQVACRNWTLGGTGIPAGTVPSASASYAPSLPIHAIDGDLSTGWNSGSSSGWLRLEFPAPTYLTGVRILAMATPSTNETYTINADLLTSPIGSATRLVYSGTAGTILDPIVVTPGTYSSLTITINGGSSWVEIGEISLITPTCP
jgi:hypothetical protein